MRSIPAQALARHCRLLLALAALGAAAQPPFARAQGEEQAVAGRALDVLSRRCFSCHGKNGGAQLNVFVLDRERLVKTRVVIPGNAASLLLRQVEGGLMPPPPEKLSPPEARAIRDWVLAGAPQWEAGPGGAQAGGGAAGQGGTAAVRQTTVSIGEFRAKDPQAAPRLKKEIAFWLARNPDMKVVESGGEINVAGSVVEEAGEEVSIIAGDRDSGRQQVARGSAANLGFLAFQVANKLTFELKRHWIPPIDPREPLTPAQREIVASGDPLQLLPLPTPKAGQKAPVNVTVAVGPRKAGETYFAEDRIQFMVHADRDCFVYVYDVDPAGQPALIFPSKNQPDNRVRANQPLTLPREGLRYTVRGALGVETVVAIASLKPLKLPGVGPDGKPITIGAKGLDVLTRGIVEELDGEAQEGYALGVTKVYTAAKP